MRAPTILAAISLAAAGSPALAASEGAWDDFRQTVREACLQAGSDLFEAPEAVVDPFGSQSYGLALLRGRAKGAQAEIAAICVYDKAGGTAEIGGELPLADAAGGEAATEAERFAAIRDCDGPCADFVASLAPDDANALRAMPQRVERSLAAIRADETLAWEESARQALDLFEAADTRFDPASVATGTRRCTLYWYGFLADAGRRVGTHSCAVERGGAGEITITKTSGEGLSGRLAPIGEGAFAFAGRSYLPEQDERRYDAREPVNDGNDNFGNVVGLAAKAQDRLILLTADMLGFQEPDPTFFGLLVVE